MIKYVLFDIDGTLADTEEIIVRSFKHIHEKFNKNTPSRDQIIKTFGEPLELTLKRDFKEDIDIVLEEYRNYHRDIFSENLKAHENAIEIVKTLYDKGYTLGVVTSRLRNTAVEILETFEIKKYFKAVVAVDDTENHKPHPEPLMKAIEKIKGEASSSIYIGDTKFDVECAKNARVKSVLVGWSHYAQDKDKIKPNFIINDFMELVNILKSDFSL